jgi:nucleoside 2-deoxyribosyltransferase
MASTETPRAFVIMPFAPEFEAVFHNLIRPALVGYEVTRADSRFDERSILAKIVTGIQNADLVVADITNTNANVMYELGVSHSFGKPTIMLSQSVVNLPFDIHAYPVHEYPSDLAQAHAISAHLGQLATQYRKGLVEFANPVLDFAPRPPPVAPPVFHAASMYSTDDFVADIQSSTAHIGSFPRRLNTAATRFSQSLAEATPKLRAAGSNNLTYFDDPGVLAAADCTREFAGEVEVLARGFHDAWEQFGRAMMWILAPEQVAQLPSDVLLSYANQARTMDGYLNLTLANIAELRHVNESFPNYSGNLTHAFAAARDALTGLLNEIMTAKGYLARIRRAIPESA